MSGPSGFYVIFGAAVRRDGTPSPTLRKRVAGALAAATDDPDPIFVPSGGIGRYGPAEADVMAALLAAEGVPDSRIIRDRDSLDTFDSVINTAPIMRSRDAGRTVVICTSRYHAPRCRLLFALHGIPARACAMPPDRPSLGLPKWLFQCAREVPATFWDALLMLIRRLKRGSGSR